MVLAAIEKFLTIIWLSSAKVCILLPVDFPDFFRICTKILFKRKTLRIFSNFFLFEKKIFSLEKIIVSKNTNTKSVPWNFTNSFLKNVFAFTEPLFHFRIYWILYHLYQAKSWNASIENLSIQIVYHTISIVINVKCGYPTLSPGLLASHSVLISVRLSNRYIWRIGIW